MRNNTQIVRVVTPGFSASLADCFKELWSYRELLVTLSWREVKIRYQQTVLGVFWAIAQPASLTIVFSIIFGKFAKIPTEGIPYPIFSYSALLPWTFFATALSFAVPSMVRERHILMKVYFPREICPLSSVFSPLVDFGITVLIFVGMMAFYRVPVTIHIFWVIPLFFIQLIFTIGISLFFSAVNARFRDVRYAVPLFLQLWMFATPIFYPVTFIPENYRILYMLNPMASIIDGYRRVIIKGVRPELRYFLLSALVSLVLFLLSYYYFKRQERKFIDVI